VTLAVACNRLTTPMRPAAALVVCLAALSAGCGDNAGPRAAKNVETQQAAPGLPRGFTLRVVKGQGFAVALPRRWRSLDAQAALRGEAMRQFRKANPQLGQQIEALTRPNSPIKMLAVDPRVRTGFVTNLNVIVTPIPSGVSFDDWTSAEVREIKSVQTVRALKQEDLRLSAGRALHLSYRASFNRPGGSYTASIHQYMVKDDGRLYILTYTSAPGSEPRYRPVFEKSARTLRLTG
jgi:hypothetical protein